MFIDSTYFVGELNIPNASVESSLTQAIAQYEKEILIQLLGYPLYSLLIADCTNYVPATQKYIDLVNGADFTHAYGGDDITLHWNGLKNTDLQSLIAYYVFYKYVERDVTRLYPAGVGASKEGDGWARASAVNKLCAAWERMRELYGKLPSNFSSPFVPSYAYTSDASAYNFLLANIDDYPDWTFTPQRNINPFGI
jgi:hypothetical protein